MSGFWRRYNIKIFFWTPNLTYVFVVPFLSCLEVLLGLGLDLDLWGAIGADFSPGPSVGVAWP